MNQSRTKATIMLVAMLSIALVCLLFVVAIVEIKKYNEYTKLVATQEQQIEDLENLKDYYNSSNYDDNASRDNGNYADGDIVFEGGIMIITITGKPCTGKSTMAEIFVNKYGFDRIYAGAIFKRHARELGIDITDLCKSEQIYEIDRKVDSDLAQIYNTRLNDNLLIESRTSWSFMPKAFNVFIDIPDNVMAERLFNSDRPENERGKTLDEALQKVTERYNADVERYKLLYAIDCNNLDNYTYVIDNSNLTPEQTADKIYQEYLKFIKLK